MPNTFIEDYCICDPINDLFIDFKEKYKDNCIVMQSGLRLFILPKSEAAQYIDEEDIAFFEIPEKYKDMKTLIHNIKNEYDLDDFTELSLDDLNRFK